MRRRKIGIACILCVGAKGKEIDGYKLWYSSEESQKWSWHFDREDLLEQVVEVRRKSDRIMFVKLVVGSEIFNVVSVYAPQIGLDEDIKRIFWEDLDEVIQSIPQTEKLLIRGDFNGYIGRRGDVYQTIHGGFGYGERNNRGGLF